MTTRKASSSAKVKIRSRFPVGMKERKARATAKTKAVVG
jgi:hypothetical protein